MRLTRAFLQIGLLVGLVVVADVVHPDRVSGQVEADSLAWMSGPTLLAEGDALHARLLPLDALAHFEAVLARDTLVYQAGWRAAREAVNAGMLAADEDRGRDFYERAERHARRALGANPDGTDGLHWLSVAVGRRALTEGVRTRVRLAEEVRRHARSVLQLDSLHAGAHHVLGEWHAEVRRLNSVERWVANRILGGNTMDEASWEQARAHLARAVQLAPAGIIHKLDLARVLLDMDDEAGARTLLGELLTLPVSEPTDPLHKQQAQEILRDLG